MFHNPDDPSDAVIEGWERRLGRRSETAGQDHPAINQGGNGTRRVFLAARTDSTVLWVGYAVQAVTDTTPDHKSCNRKDHDAVT